MRVRLQQLVQTHVVAAGDGAQGVTLARLMLLLMAGVAEGMVTLPPWGWTWPALGT